MGGGQRRHALPSAACPAELLACRATEKWLETNHPRNQCELQGTRENVLSGKNARGDEFRGEEAASPVLTGTIEPECQSIRDAFARQRGIRHQLHSLPILVRQSRERSRGSSSMSSVGEMALCYTKFQVWVSFMIKKLR